MSFVLETVLRSSMVLTIGFAALAALKHQPAALRHWVLMATLAMAAAQPAINRIIPAWNITGQRAAPPPSKTWRTSRREPSSNFRLPRRSSARRALTGSR